MITTRKINIMKVNSQMKLLAIKVWRASQEK
jgi:hypothetical protein